MLRRGESKEKGGWFPQPPRKVAPFPIKLIEMYPSLGRGNRERMISCTLCLPISQIEELEKIKAKYGAAL